MATQEQMARYARWAEQDRKMQAVGKVAFWAAAAVLALTFYLAFDQDAAMKSCMAKGYSYSTCVHTLR